MQFLVDRNLSGAASLSHRHHSTLRTGNALIQTTPSQILPMELLCANHPAAA
jgi:hypothetical protein